MGENREYVVRPDEKGSINISEDVIAVIAGAAATEVDGVAGLATAAGRELSIGRKNLSKGVRVTVDENDITVDISIVARSGAVINTTGRAVQDAVSAAVESTTGLTVIAVNVHVCGISAVKEK